MAADGQQGVIVSDFFDFLSNIPDPLNATG